MGSGKPPRPEPALLVAALAALLTASCLLGGGSFDKELGLLDSALSSRRPDPRAIGASFGSLYRKARDSSDWLALAKRSPVAESLGDRGRMGETARRASKALPSSGPVAEAAAWLHLRSGDPSAALAALKARSDRAESLGLWAEARLGASAGKASLAPAELGDLAKATGDPSYFYHAALASMVEGDRFAAQSWLKAGMEGGFRAPPEVLWDAGLERETLAAARRMRDPTSLSIGGDAAWALGDRSAARGLWNLAAAIDPDASWQLSVDLALLEEDPEASAAAARRLAAAHPGEPSALRYAAALLLRAGAAEEAAALVPGLARGGDPLSSFLGVELSGGSESKRAAEAIGFLSSYGDDPRVREAVMRFLILGGRFEEFLAVYDEGLARGGAGPGGRPHGPGAGAARGGENAWFYATVERLLRGDEAGAREASLGASPGRTGGGAPAPFAQGLLAALGGDPETAREGFSLALSLARTARERSTILVELGRLEEAAGRFLRAKELWKAAAQADPADAEAAVLAVRSR